MSETRNNVNLSAQKTKRSATSECNSYTMM